MGKIAFCFPGQGALEAGMGRELAEAVPAAMEVYRVGSEASGLDLQKLCFDSPLEDLVETEVQQPALVATCLAILAAMREAGLEPDVVVGHSVGEFSALASVGAIGTPEAIALVRERGLAMAEAARERPGSMAAILGLEDEAVETLCRQILGVWPANYNCPGQIVISGENDAVEECCAEAESLGARRAIKLKVSGAFHSPLVGERRQAPQARDRPRPLPRADRTVHVDRDRQDRARDAAGLAARRPAHRAGPVHAGSARARPRRRHHLRRGGAGQRALRPRQAHRQERAHVLGQRPRQPGEGPGGPLIVSGFCSLDGKTALVTGASRGIGRAIAVELAAAGATVVVGYRSGQDEAEEVANEIGGRAVQADVSDAASALALVEAAGDIDILVNNAGLTRDGLLARMSDDDWRTVIDTNLSSVFYTCRAVTRPMMKKRAGAIVNVSSIVGVHGNWGQTNYAASKAGIIGFTKSLAKELGSRNVRANVVAPGYVTDAADRRPAGRGDGGDARADAARPARRSGRRCRRRSLPLLRRGLVRDGRSAARRRRPRDVAWMPVSSDNGRRRIVVTGIGAVTSLGNTFEETWAGVDRRPLRRRPDHAVRHHRLPGALRLRGAATSR